MEAEPFAPMAVDLGVARLRAAIANGTMVPPRGERAFTPRDFWIEHWERPKVVAPTAQPATAKQLVSLFKR